MRLSSNIHRCARLLRNQFRGRMPSTHKVLWGSSRVGQNIEYGGKELEANTDAYNGILGVSPAFFNSYQFLGASYVMCIAIVIAIVSGFSGAFQWAGVVRDGKDIEFALDNWNWRGKIRGREEGREGRKEIIEERDRQAFHTIMLRDASRMLRWQPLILRKAQSARLMRWHRAWIAHGLQEWRIDAWVWLDGLARGGCDWRKRIAETIGIWEGRILERGGRKRKRERKRMRKMNTNWEGNCFSGKDGQGCDGALSLWGYWVGR